MEGHPLLSRALADFEPSWGQRSEGEGCLEALGQTCLATPGVGDRIWGHFQSIIKWKGQTQSWKPGMRKA